MSNFLECHQIILQHDRWSCTSSVVNIIYDHKQRWFTLIAQVINLNWFSDRQSFSQLLIWGDCSCFDLMTSQDRCDIGNFSHAAFLQVDVHGFVAPIHVIVGFRIVKFGHRSNAFVTSYTRCIWLRSCCGFGLQHSRYKTNQNFQFWIETKPPPRKRLTFWISYNLW